MRPAWNIRIDLLVIRSSKVKLYSVIALYSMTAQRHESLSHRLICLPSSFAGRSTMQASSTFKQRSRREEKEKGQRQTTLSSPHAPILESDNSLLALLDVFANRSPLKNKKPLRSLALQDRERGSSLAEHLVKSYVFGRSPATKA